MRRSSAYRRFQRRPSRPARPTPREDRSEALAQELMDGRSLAELQAILAEREAAYEEADRLGQDQPSPASLQRYRAARADLEVARRAVELARRNQAPEA